MVGGRASHQPGYSGRSGIPSPWLQRDVEHPITKDIEGSRASRQYGWRQGIPSPWLQWDVEHPITKDIEGSRASHHNILQCEVGHPITLLSMVSRLSHPPSYNGV